MDSEETKPKKRGRKRTRDQSKPPSGYALVGHRVRKEFMGIGVFSGKVIRYKRGGLYRVDYEDGDFEDLEYREVLAILVDDAAAATAAPTVVTAASTVATAAPTVATIAPTVATAALTVTTAAPTITIAGLTATTAAPTAGITHPSEDEDLGFQKDEKLDQLVSVPISWKRPDVSDKVGESMVVSKLSSDDAGSDSDSSSVSCKSQELSTSIPLPPPLPLPPSSGNIGVPDESVSFLFSVYNFLRSFSHQLFLSPFGIDDFIGSLNCTLPNSLFDAVHVSLMRAMRRHLELVSLDSGNGELASKCLRCLDWSLLDTLTWTVYVVEYLLIMGYAKGQEWKGFRSEVFRREYYNLPVLAKLRILQILCDDLLEFMELRTEIDTRERAEEGMDSDDNAALPPENGPKRVHPRYSKTSACKDPENIVETFELKPLSHNQSSADSSNAIELEAKASDVVDDGNSDECQLCGMDGTLVCCDGCPSVYHSRCIGLNKAYLPDGMWFCPECVVKQMGPVCSRFGTGLKGAEIFGIDPHERVFLGTCNYILVLETSINAEPLSRYYSQNDVLELLRVLCSSSQHALMYPQICKGILRYYGLKEDLMLLHLGVTDPDTKLLDGNENMFDTNTLDGKEDTMGFSTVLDKENHISLHKVEHDNCTSDACKNNVEKGAVPSCQENDFHEAGVIDPASDSCQGELLGQQKDDFQLAPGYAEVTTQQLCPPGSTNFQEQLGTESTTSAPSLIFPIDPSDLNHLSSGERSTILGFATGSSRDIDNSGGEDADSMLLYTDNGFQITSFENRQNRSSDRRNGDAINCGSYMGTSFKPQAYINQYILGDVAASAAANLAVLASENGKSSEAQSTSNPRKIVSENISLQVKAFSGAAVHFQWPSSERKSMEVPRERCGWCISCKGSVSTKRGCLLNSAASNSLKGAARVIGGVRPVKNGDGPLTAIAAYIIGMMESLHGLIVGPLLTVSYRKQWRKQVEEASTCSSLKLLLLELEENIHSLALSGGWFKPVDEWSVKLSTAQFGTCVVGSAQKRGPSTRRNRKQSATSEITAAADWKYVHWWRGGKLSKVVLQTGILPRSLVKKAARQGGYKRIYGIHYAEGSEIPRRSRRIAWRAAVEMSNNVSQLALQVRFLDAHVRWSDIVHPDLFCHDGNETSAFRNAVILNKRIVESKIRYLLDFGNQKHLPSRVMKNILEFEHNQNGEEMFWFSENHVPLYLIKKYEEKAEKVPLLLTKKDAYLKFPRRQMKAHGRDIFSYLMHRDDNISCALCQQEVLLRNAVKCNVCQGYCHKDCTVPSTAELKDEMEFVRICKQCYRNVQMSLQERHHTTLGTKSILQNQYNHISPSTGNVEVSLETKPSYVTQKKTKPPSADHSSGRVQHKRSGTCLNYGLIWKKNKNKPENDMDFRVNNILMKGNADANPSVRPVCSLCEKPYDSSLMYIRCEHCSKWFHADAVHLREEQIFELVGFKCCKCRRIKVPICPYMSQGFRKIRMKTMRRQGGNERKEADMMLTGSSFGKPALGEPTTPVLHAKTEFVAAEVDDPLLFSLENVEPIVEQMLEGKPEWNASPALCQNPQKLPVRRQVKQENNMEGLSAYPTHDDAVSHGTDAVNVKESLAEWDFHFGGEMSDFQGGNTEDMEFEPQTYFSFTELLATEDDKMDGLFDASVDVPGNLSNSSGRDDMGAVCETMPSCNPFDSYDMGMVNSLQELTTADSVQCQMCAQPAPDCLCEICGLQIHHHCSPWEEPSGDNRWRCGRCRDWR